MAFVHSNLGGTPLGQKEQLASCVKLLLLWVAASDGKVDESELEFAASNFPETEQEITTSDLLEVIRRADLQSLEMAIRTVAGQSRELRTAFLDMAITMSLADREIAISENHILRFYADALYLGTGMLEKRFRAISGGVYFEPGDPGSMDWWEQTVTETDDRSEDTESPDIAGSRMTPKQARAILGVGAKATQDEIERAYQDLSAIFQIQRVETMGEAAVAVANKRLMKIEMAHGLLRD